MLSLFLLQEANSVIENTRLHGFSWRPGAGEDSSSQRPQGLCHRRQNREGKGLSSKALGGDGPLPKTKPKINKQTKNLLVINKTYFRLLTFGNIRRHIVFSHVTCHHAHRTLTPLLNSHYRFIPKFSTNKLNLVSSHSNTLVFPGGWFSCRLSSQSPPPTLSPHRGLQKNRQPKTPSLLPTETLHLWPALNFWHPGACSTCLACWCVLPFLSPNPREWTCHWKVNMCCLPVCHGG